MTKKEFVLDEPWFKIKGVAGNFKYDNPFYYAISNPGFGRIVDENECVFGKIIIMNRFGFTVLTTENIELTILFKDFILV